MKTRAWIQTFLISALCAGLVWALSPVIAGHKEPWDAAAYYYPSALFIAGFVSGLITPRIRWAYYWGAIAGQVLYEFAFLALGPLALVGILQMCIYAVAFLVAALFASFLRIRFHTAGQKP